MKVVKVSIILLIICMIFVILNSVILQQTFTSMIEKISDTDCNESEYVNIYNDFKQKVKYISLTVNQSDITNIEESIAELIGYSTANDESSVKAVKSRLISSLEHLRRLSGINIDSIF